MEFKRHYRELMRGRAVLVAGADGFIGLNVVKALVAQGARVTALSRNHDSPATDLADRKLQLDLANFDALCEVVTDHDIVFDCVGASGAVDSNVEAYRNIDIECRPHLNLFDACSRVTEPPVVVFLSSRLVYGKAGSVPVAESTVLSPNSMYAVHKVTLEHYLDVFAETRSLPHVVLRVANPFGAHRGGAGKGYGVVNQFIDKALAGQPIDVFGDGRQLRDYIYIDDLVDIMTAVALEPECRNSTFNVGSGDGISLADAVATIIAVSNSGSAVNHVPWPPASLAVETGDYVSDTSRLTAATGCRGFLDFASGVRRTIAAQRSAAAV